MNWDAPYVFATMPFALAAAWWIFRPRGSAKVFSFANITRLWADRRGLSDSANAPRRRARGVLLALGSLCALAALARPQWGTIEETTFDQSREVMIALDLSRSMLADDVKPTRLARAKLLIESLLEQLKGERVGLIVFSGTAFVQSPLSADYEVLRDLLKDLDPSYLPQGGTDYGAMLNAADGAFGQTGGGDRFLVVLSDGEAHDDAWQSQVAVLQARGIRFIGLGIGTADGAVLPDGKGGLLKDDTGGVVLSRLEPRTLEQLAEQTHGVYRDAATWVDIAELVRGTVDQGTKEQYVEQKQVRQQDRFQWLLAPAVLFFLLSYWIELPAFPAARTIRRPQPAARVDAMGIARAAVLLLALLLAPRFASAAGHEPSALETTVAELSARPSLAASDYARLAQQTVDFASQPNAPSSPTRTGVIDDALTAVNIGEAADAHAADWPTLRKQLETLKQAQQQQPNPQQNQQQQQSSGSGEQQEKQDQQNAQQGQGGNESRNDSKGQPQSQKGQSGEERGKEQQKPESAGRPANEQQAENGKASGSGDSNGKGEDSPPKSDQAGTDKLHSNESHSDKSRNADAQHEIAENKDQKPLASAEAALGKLDAEKSQPSDAAQEQPAAPPETRMVGGGRARPDASANGDPALAAALGKMERVKDGDAPAMLFERMSRADNPKPPRTTGKNW